MRKSPPLARVRAGLVLAAAAIVVSGCANIRYDDQHADRSTRNYLIASQMNTTFKTRGMAGVVGDIEDCYRATTTTLIKRFALQDCLSYDYAAYELDATTGQLFFGGMRTPYFDNSVATTRWAKYGKLDGFGDSSELLSHLRTNNVPIYQDLQRIPGSAFAANPRTRRAVLPQPNGSL